MILSIICPTLNEEKYIAQTLDSFMNQQYHSFELEILICDGMSKDDTRNIVAEYANKFPCIRLIDNEKRKTPFAFNAGLQAASGEYVAILGAHTKYEPNYLQGLYWLVTGLWGLIDVHSFMKVTGPKTDIWLVKTVECAYSCNFFKLTVQRKRQW